MEAKCIVSSCGKAASKCCGSCVVIRYCSSECQKDDWKLHHKKEECVNMRKLSTVSLTGKEISDVAYKVSNMAYRLSVTGETKKSIDLLKEGIEFVRVRRGRLDRNDPFLLAGDNLMLCRLLVDLGNIYLNMPTSSEIATLAISYLSDAHQMLVQMRDSKGFDNTVLWQLLWKSDSYLFQLYSQRGQLDKAKYHSLDCIASAKHFEGTDAIDYLSTALSMYSGSLYSESNFTEALAIGEEAYTIASKHYSPSHKKVLKASRQMINCLIAMREYDSADAFCRMNYANLIDPMNAGEYDVEDGPDIMSQLAKIWLIKEPDEDEILAKAHAEEAVDLARQVYENSKRSRRTHNSIKCLNLLCQVLLKAYVLTEETEGHLHKLVSVHVAEYTSNSSNLCSALMELGKFYLRLDSTFPMEKKSSLVLINLGLCHKRLLELEACTEGSDSYMRGAVKIKPYYKINSELCI